MRYIIPIVLAAICASCSSSSKPPPQSASSPSQRGAVIMRAVGRHETIIARAGVNGPTYSLVSNRGEVLVDDMTLEQLALKDPELFHAIKTIEANVLWAGE